MIGRWPKWNSVWINSDSPNDAFYSNDATNDWYRFQVINNPESEKNWTWLSSADINYGKFSNGSYPYQLWEVSYYYSVRTVLIYSFCMFWCSKYALFQLLYIFLL